MFLARNCIIEKNKIWKKNDIYLAEALLTQAVDAGESIEAVLEPRDDWSHVVLRATRDPADAETLPATGLYRIRAAERYDEKGFPPALAARIREIRAAVR